MTSTTSYCPRSSSAWLATPCSHDCRCMPSSAPSALVWSASSPDRSSSAASPSVMDMLADLLVVDVDQSIQHIGRQRLQVSGGGVAPHLRRVARPRDDRADTGLVEDPPQRQLGGRGPLGVGGHAARRAHPDLERHATEGPPDVEGLALAVVGAVVLRRERGGLVVLA